MTIGHVYLKTTIEIPILRFINAGFFETKQFNVHEKESASDFDHCFIWGC